MEFFQKEKNGSKRIISFFGLKFSYNTAKKYKYIPVREHGLSQTGRTPKIIISLTSFPDRIPTLHRSLASLLNQTLKPDMVILWLAKEQFPDLENNLPEEILNLKEFGLSIRWCNDIKSYKKLVPALKEFPHDIIVTADDDVFYDRTMLEKLYNSYKKFPQNIHCHKTKKIIFKDGKITAKQKKCYKYPSFANIPVGVGGVLYPPHSLFKDAVSEELFTKLAPTNDDLWFWASAVLNNTKIMKIEHNIDEPVIIEETYDSPKLSDINNHGEKLFYVQLENILNYYGELKDKVYACIKNQKLLHS